MYRCYLIRNGRIAIGDDVDVETLSGAMAYGRRLIADRSKIERFSGMEIWCGSSLVYSDTGYAGDTRSAAAIHSPFQTAESTILPNWRPSLARPILAIRSAEQDALAAADGLSVIKGEGRQPAPEAETLSFARRLRKAIRRRPAHSPIAA